MCLSVCLCVCVSVCLCVCVFVSLQGSGGSFLVTRRGVGGIVWVGGGKVCRGECNPSVVVENTPI